MVIVTEANKSERILFSGMIDNIVPCIEKVVKTHRMKQRINKLR